MSGANDAASIAERRKLEAELFEAREELNDTYYEHSMDSRQEALDAEAEAYEQSMNKFIEGLRVSLEEAQSDMAKFMSLVENAVMTNAPAIKAQYESLGLSLDSAIISPWTEAANKIEEFGGVDGLGVMNKWISEGGIFPTFKSGATDALQSPWEAGTSALNTFKNSVTTKMGDVYDDVETNVASSLEELEKLKAEIDKINTTKVEPKIDDGDEEDDDGDGGDDGLSYTKLAPKSTKYITTDTKVDTSAVYLDDSDKEYYKLKGSSKRFVPKSSTYNKKGILYAVEGSYYYTSSELRLRKKADGTNETANTSGGTTVSKYATGTLSTSRDGLAITDESWIGEEITLAAGKNGQLQYLKKGSAVMPADISANLVEWGKINPDMMRVGGGANLNMISNAVNKPEFNLTFDALVKADRIDEGTLPEIKKFVTQEINSLVKQMNYAIKGYSR